MIQTSPEERFRLLLEKAETESAKAEHISPAHGADHLQRVWNRCMTLSEKLGGDLEVLAAAAALHDLGRHYGLEVHGEKSAELAAPILSKTGFPREKTLLVLDAIRFHDVTTPPGSRKSMESRILYDADKLDSFGVLGVIRHIVFYYQKGAGVDYILDTLSKRWVNLHFEQTREMGREDYEYVLDFFKKLGDIEGGC
ncbi:MAG: HD domain-containing protein [Candidatus Altiarchaeota archaeon]